jgi:hypothetical protein
MNAFSVLRRGIAAAALSLLPGTTLPAAEPSAAQVHATLQAAEAVRAVKRLQHAYAFYLNEGLWGDAADLFTGNAAAQFGGEAVSGRDALRRHLMQQAGRRQNGLAPGQLHMHLIMQPIITLGADGRSARGTWHEMQMLGRFGRSAEWTGGVYENEYRLDGGVWKISRLHYYPQYAGSFDDYGHRAPAKWGIPYHFDAKHVGVTVPPPALAALAAAAPPVDAVRLQRRAALLRDETEVQNLQHAFGYYLDRKLWDDVADLFARGGSLELGARGAYVGRERIRKALETFHGPAPLRRGELFDHILLGTVVTISADGRRAAARSTELGQIGLNGQYARWEVGTYENQFIREDGKWKIAAVRHFPRLITDYDLGWARDAQPAPGISQEFPPDRRPAQRFASYPVRQSVAPHFVNPVTGRRAGSPGGAVAAVPVVTAPEFPDRRTLYEAIAVSGPRVDLLALERLARIAIGVDATENLMSSYGYYIDESAWDEMADTYASTGAKEVTGAGVYVGPERIRRILKLRGPLGGRTASFFTIHQLTQPVIHVADDGLSAKARVRLFQAGGNADGSSGSWIGGIYENTALVEHGEWKFGIQDLHHIFNASYRNGWARVGPGVTSLPGRPPSARDQRGGGITQGLGGARAGPRLADEMPPDRAIRARQYAFPDISEPAFHYVNPVSGRRPAELLP